MEGKISLLSIIVSFILFGCGTPKKEANNFPFKNVPPEYKDDANRMLTDVMEDAGLYTLLGDFKPLSTVPSSSLSIYQKAVLQSKKSGILKEKKKFNFPKNEEEAKRYHKMILDTVAHYSKVLEAMSGDKLHFQFLPVHSYKRKSTDAFEVTYMPEILLLRKDLLKKLIEEKASFFKSIHVDTSDYIAQLKENLFDLKFREKSKISRSDKHRVWGYLYGYPDYAVDFYVNATKNFPADTVINGKLNDRQPVRIPVLRNDRYYSYMVPKGSMMRNEDIQLLKYAKEILDEFKVLRPEYENGSGFDAISFIQDWYKEKNM